MPPHRLKVGNTCIYGCPWTVVDLLFRRTPLAVYSFKLNSQNLSLATLFKIHESALDLHLCYWTNGHLVQLAFIYQVILEIRLLLDFMIFATL